MEIAISIFFCKSVLMFPLHIFSVTWLHTLILICLMSKYLLIFCYVLETLLRAGNTAVNNTNKNACPF